jgi:hypothetical protein
MRSIVLNRIQTIKIVLNIYILYCNVFMGVCVTIDGV